MEVSGYERRTVLEFCPHTTQTFLPSFICEKLSNCIFLTCFVVFFFLFFFSLVGSGHPSFMRREVTQLVTNKTLSNRSQMKILDENTSLETQRPHE